MDVLGLAHSSCRSIGAAVLLVLAVITASACAVRRATGPYQVLPAAPEYIIRSPDRDETPLLETLSQYANTGSGWWDLLPEMGLRIENAYCRQGARKNGLEGYIGTEIARFQVRAGRGLRLISVVSRLTEVRPANAPPVQELIPETQRRRPQHRFFFTIVFKRKDDVRNAVLLNAQTAGELARLAMRLLEDPDALCGGKSENCTVFPRTCTVSLEVEITVNGKKQMLP